MKWNEAFSPMRQPTMEEISAHVARPEWAQLCAHVEKVYGVKPSVEHSGCTMAPGWNVKYKKSGKALCSLYPEEDVFTCLVVVPEKDMLRVELMLALCGRYVQELFAATKCYMGGKWLMIDVNDHQRLEDVKRLLTLRPVKPMK